MIPIHICHEGQSSRGLFDSLYRCSCSTCIQLVTLCKVWSQRISMLMDALESFERRKHTQGTFSGTSRYKVYQLSNLHRFDDQRLLNLYGITKIYFLVNVVSSQVSLALAAAGCAAGAPKWRNLWRDLDQTYPGSSCNTKVAMRAASASETSEASILPL